MRAENRRRMGLLLALFVLLFGTAVIISAQGNYERTEYYEIQLDARARMERCMEAIRGYREELGIEFSPEDWHRTGLIGEDFSDITTTLGAIEAKRTAADPDMAALVVRMFQKAGLQRGDPVGAGFSGSFPSLNLAVICASDAMGLDLTYITSIGSSTYGANHVLLTFPDIAHRLFTDGLISRDSAMVTPGGARDMGEGTMDERAFDPILARLEAAGLTILREPDFQKNLAVRRAVYGDSIVCFAAAGGNVTSMGRGDGALSLGQGLLMPAVYHSRGDEDSGLVEWYLAQGIPVVNLLNVRKIAADYAMPFDPQRQAAAGESPIYFDVRFAKWPIVVVLAVTLAALAVGCRRNRHPKQ